MKYKKRDMGFVNFLYRNLSYPVTKLFVKTSMTPNQISIIGFIFGLVAVYFFSFGEYQKSVIAVLFLQASMILDSADGMVARAKSMCSKYGEFLELVTDHIEYPLIIGAVTYGVYTNQKSVMVLLLGFVSLVILMMIQKINEFIHWNIASTVKSSKIQKIKTRKTFLIKRIAKKLLSEFELSITFVYFALSIFAILNRLYLFLIIMAIYGSVFFLVVLCIARKAVVRIDKIQKSNDKI